MLVRMNNSCNAFEDLDCLSIEKYLNLLECFVDVGRDLLIGIFEINVIEALEPEQEKYILENIAFNSNKWVFPWKPFQKNINTVWVKPKNMDEVKKIIGMAGSCMFYAVVDKNQLLDDISYVIYNISLEHDGLKRRMYAINKKENEFIKNVLPKILKLFPDIECIQDSNLKANIYE